MLDINVSYTVPKVEWYSFEQDKEQALQVVKDLESLEITENNLKEGKKKIAEVRKVTAELNNKRKEIKAEMLTSLTEFSNKVKEIDDILTQAVNVQRDKVEQYEFQIANKKFDTIKEIFDKRNKAYSEYNFDFSEFYKSQFLNKTYKLDKIELEMVDFFENKKQEIETIKTLNNADDILIEYYINGYNMSNAINTVNKRIEIAKNLEIERKKPLEQPKNPIKIEPTQPTQAERQEQDTLVIEIKGAEKIALAKMLLESNKIDYTVL